MNDVSRKKFVHMDLLSKKNLAKKLAFCFFDDKGSTQKIY